MNNNSNNQSRLKIFSWMINSWDKYFLSKFLFKIFLYISVLQRPFLKVVLYMHGIDKRGLACG